MFLDGGEGEDEDDDDLWDGWGEDAPTEAPQILGTKIEVIENQITPNKDNSKNHFHKDFKEEKEKEKEIGINTNKDTNTNKVSNSIFLSKNILNENEIKDTMKMLREQQQQRRRDQKSVKIEKQKLRQKEKLAERIKNGSLEQEECSLREGLEESMDDVNVMSGDEVDSGEYDEEEEEGDGNDYNDDREDGEEEEERLDVRKGSEEGSGKNKGKDKGKGKGKGKGGFKEIPMMNSKELLQRRLRRQSILNSIVRDYTTAPSTQSVLTTNSGNDNEKSPSNNNNLKNGSNDNNNNINNDNNNGNANENEKKKNRNMSTITMTSDNLQSDPRLCELLQTLAASQQCCSKLWSPKKATENAYTKVSVSTSHI